MLTKNRSCKQGLFIFLFSVLFTQQACANTTDIPVRMGEGVHIEFLLEEETAKSMDSLDLLLKGNWYAPIKIIIEEGKPETRVVKSCFELIKTKTNRTRSFAPHEMDPYIVTSLHCQAADLLNKATPSKTSFLSTFNLNKNTPKELPSAFALVISTTEIEKVNADDAWNTVTTITESEIQSHETAVYKHLGGNQTLEVIGFGDTNHDNIEDVILLLTDTVTDGNYFNLRLFSVTKLSADAPLIVIKEYSY